jgi:dipeptidase
MPVDGVSLPFSVIPAEPVTRRNIFSVLRDHYEGSRLAVDGCPLHSSCEGRPVTVCHGSTNHGDVFQLRADAPDGLRAVWWYGFWRPCNSPFLPLFPAAGWVPDELAFDVHELVFSDPSSGEMPGRDKAIGMFRDLTLKLDQSSEGELKQIREHWSKFEREQDDELKRLTGKSSAGLRELADFSSQKLQQAMQSSGSVLEE